MNRWPGQGNRSTAASARARPDAAKTLGYWGDGTAQAPWTAAVAAVQELKLVVLAVWFGPAAASQGTPSHAAHPKLNHIHTESASEGLHYL